MAELYNLSNFSSPSLSTQVSTANNLTGGIFGPMLIVSISIILISLVFWRSGNFKTAYAAGVFTSFPVSLYFMSINALPEWMFFTHIILIAAAFVILKFDKGY